MQDYILHWGPFHKGIALHMCNSCDKVLQLRIRSAESCVRIFLQWAPGLYPTTIESLG